MAKKTQTLQPGQRIAYTRAFLASYGNDYNMAQRRGTFLGYDDHMSARVRWDGITEAEYAAFADRYGQDFVDDIREHGSAVHRDNVCGTKSTAFIEA